MVTSGIDVADGVNPNGCLAIEWALVFADTATDTQILYDPGAKYRGHFHAGAYYYFLLQLNSLSGNGTHLLADYAIAILSPRDAALPINQGHTQHFLSLLCQ